MLDAGWVSLSRCWGGKAEGGNASKHAVETGELIGQFRKRPGMDFRAGQVVCRDSRDVIGGCLTIFAGGLS